MSRSKESLPHNKDCDSFLRELIISLARGLRKAYHTTRIATRGLLPQQVMGGFV